MKLKEHKTEKTFTKPYSHQKDGIKRIEKFKGRAIIGDEMGLGKSFQIFLWAATHPEIKRTLIVCPAGLKFNWADEASQHLHHPSTILEGKPPTRRNPMPIYDGIYIISCELLQNGFDVKSKKAKKGWLRFLLSCNFDLIIIDEAHYFKNREAKRTQALFLLCKKIQYILALTGTPITSVPAEIWPILHILDPKRYKSFFSFAFKFCGPKRMPWGWDYKGATKIDVLYKRLVRTCLIRRKFDDVLKDVPKTSIHIVPMEIVRRHEYQEALDDFIIWLSKFMSSSKLRRIMKAQRLIKYGYLLRLVARLKLKYVMRWVDAFLSEKEGKLILFATHKRVIKRLAERYEGVAVIVDGSVSNDERKRRYRAFQTNDRIRLLIGNTQAAGVGWNGQVAQTVAFCEFPWTPGLMKQAMGRVRRIGQKKKTRAYILTAHKTIEEKLLRLLQDKQTVSDQMLDGDFSGKTEFNLWDRLTSEILDERT